MNNATQTETKSTALCKSHFQVCFLFLQGYSKQTYFGFSFGLLGDSGDIMAFTVII